MEKYRKMETGKTYEELVELLQEGRIGHLRFILESGGEEEYLEWCVMHGTEPSDESAEFFIEQTDTALMDSQETNDGDYGIWN